MTEWGGPMADLDRYLQRVGLGASAQRHRPTARLLRELHRAHVLSIPFENIDVLLGREVNLAVDALERKLVRQRRGGVCHEHNLLFAAVLESIGYRVRRVLTRVRDDGVTLLPRGHSALIVEVEGDRWLCDVGYGCDGPIEPIPLSASIVHHGQWTFELEPGPDMWRLCTGDPTRSVLYSVMDAEYRRPDFDLAAYFLLTHPSSPFSTGLVVQRAALDVRYSLRNLDLTVAHPDGQRLTRRLAPTDLAAVLRNSFGIDLGGSDISTILGFIESRADTPLIPL